MGTHPIFESDFDCLTVQKMLASEDAVAVAAPTEHDAIQAMKDEGTFDVLRKACLECLEKNACFLSFRADFDGDVDPFLSKQKWKNSAEYKEQARRELRKYALQTQ